MLFTPAFIFAPDVAVATTTTFDPANLFVSAALSNGNLTMTGGATISGARSIANHTTGKYYCEYTIDLTTGGTYVNGVGFANGSWNSSSSLGNDANLSATIWIQGDGSYYTNSNTPQSGAFNNILQTDIISMAIDIGAGKAWFRVNGGTWSNSGDPAAGTNAFTFAISGAIYAAVQNPASQKITANFGGTAYAYTAPVGYGNW